MMSLRSRARVPRAGARLAAHPAIIKVGQTMVDPSSHQPRWQHRLSVLSAELQQPWLVCNSAPGPAAARVAAVHGGPQVRRVAMAPGGPFVSELICGAMRFNGTPAETLQMIKDCVKIGVTTFDVAAVYGGGEAVRGVEHNVGGESPEPAVQRTNCCSLIESRYWRWRPSVQRRSPLNHTSGSRSRSSPSVASRRKMTRRSVSRRLPVLSHYCFNDLGKAL